jgi:hypothetical protein
MARKSPQPLTLTDPRSVDPQQQSPLSPKSPTSPKSPFRFSSKKGQGEQPPMQIADTLSIRSTFPPSQNSVSLPSLQIDSTASGAPEKQEREKPARSGFFSNYKASKSSSRLQHADAAKHSTTEESMSRDTDRPGKVSSQDVSRIGTTPSVSSSLFRCKY